MHFIDLVIIGGIVLLCTLLAVDMAALWWVAGRHHAKKLGFRPRPA